MAEITMTYVGGPTVLIEAGGWRILTDPTFDAPGGRFSFGWATYSKKLQGPALPFTALEPIDAVLISHEHHRDNLDQSARRRLPQMGKIVTTTTGAERLRLGARGLRPFESMVLEAPGKRTIEITATPCRHGPPGWRPIVGDVIGFVLRWVDQTNGALWVSGDTTFFPGMNRIKEQFDIGTAVLHLGAVKFGFPSGPLKYTMGAEDAVEVCRLIDPKRIIPVHFEGWRHYSEGREETERVLQNSGFATRVDWLTPGQPLTIEV